MISEPRAKDAIVGRGSFSGPCIPELAEHYFEKVSALLALARVGQSASERAALRTAFLRRLTEAYEQTPYARFVVAYGPTIPVRIEIVAFSLEDEIKNWMDGHGGSEPYGVHPDAKVMSLARSISLPARVLDVGAGDGRNALPLAKLGLSVDALEPAEVLVSALRASAAAAQLPVRVLPWDLFAAKAQLEAQSYQLVVVSEVFTHFTRAELDQALAKLSPALAPGGHLLCNAFLWNALDEPELLARQVGKTLWATFFTKAELLQSCAKNGLDLLEDEAAAAYEKAHLPPEAWPPNKWFEGWASGGNVFDELYGTPPVELRWLLLRRP